MEFDFNSLSLIDMISEKHAQLRQHLEQRWDEQSDIHFTHSEWHLLAKIGQQSLSISQAANIVGMSRQAMQKIVKKLESQGYINTYFKAENKRDKYLALSSSGQQCRDKIDALKNTIEHEMKARISDQEVDHMKKLFSKEWLAE